MRWLPWLVLGLSVSAVALAAPALPPACTAPEHRQFDFWIGDWEVTTPDGEFAGTNRITRELGDCVLHEHWAGSRGGFGESFNAWDARTRRWHQTWVDDRGTLLVLEGGREGESMVLVGSHPDTAAAAGTGLERITWTPMSDGVVRQLWESSKDGGKSWTTAFDGRYRKRAAKP